MTDLSSPDIGKRFAILFVRENGKREFVREEGDILHCYEHMIVLQPRSLSSQFCEPQAYDREKLTEIIKQAGFEVGYMNREQSMNHYSGLYDAALDEELKRIDVARVPFTYVPALTYA